MSYIRAKEIPPKSGNWYDYEVKGIRRGNKVIQKVIRYIGRSGSSGLSVSGCHAIAVSSESITPINSDARILGMKTNSGKISSANRGAGDAKILMNRAQRVAGRKPAIVRTDKLRSYDSGVGDIFGGYTRHVKGGPFKSLDSGESTAEIERFHRTLEQRTEVFQKFKDIESIRLLTQGWLINYNFFKQNEGCGNIPPAQAMSKVVPFKDWNDIVIPEGSSDMDYKVTLHKRESVKRGYPVYDATLTPFNPFKDVVPNDKR
jgi:hypothetical protein